MKKSKKILITSESREFYILHGRKNPLRFCPECGRETEILTLDRAVTLSEFPVREIVRRIEAGEIQFRETAAGHLLFCRDCLLQNLSVRKIRKF